MVLRDDDVAAKASRGVGAEGSPPAIDFECIGRVGLEYGTEPGADPSERGLQRRVQGGEIVARVMVRPLQSLCIWLHTRTCR